ncbi:MAG: hypothetical protein N3D85_00910 [Candidatus Bathyarchaeota archaeon]|nr:hypothetical protein [Candidatus Bathyarchaeota archaeon]
MKIKREGIVFLFLVILLSVIVSAISFTIDDQDLFRLAVRLFALNGFMALSLATILTPFLKEIKAIFGQPFIKVHHSFAAFGLVFVTLHPLLLAISASNFGVFLPNFSSWYTFWALGGRQAFIIFLVALSAVLVRRKLIRYWRMFHVLMYLVLFFAIVHGNLIGTDFENPLISLTFNALFAVSIGAFILKRFRNMQIKKTMSPSKNSKVIQSSKSG